MSGEHPESAVEIVNRQRRYDLDRGVLVMAIDAVLELCGEAGQVVTVTLVSDRTMKQINRDYRGLNQPTDVLSFSMREGDGGDVSGMMLGDLVVSLETIVRQAGESFTDGRPETGTAQRELALMTIHGLLHLMGFAHEEGGFDEAQMITREHELFNQTWEFFPVF
jgi:probable rRNA maturation factor